MARPPMFKAQEKQRMVLSVLRGECSVAEAARRNKCSETSIAKWRDQFVQGGLGALEARAQQGPSAPEARLERELEQVTSAARGGARGAAAAQARGRGFRFEELEVIGLQAGLDVRRFCALAGIPTTTWYRQRQRALGGAVAKGPWPRPVSDRVVAVVHAYALKYPAWGHRKIWALTVADGHNVSQRTCTGSSTSAGCSTGAAIRPSGASWPRRASRPSTTRRPADPAQSRGRPTSPSPRPGPAGPGR